MWWVCQRWSGLRRIWGRLFKALKRDDIRSAFALCYNISLLLLRKIIQMGRNFLHSQRSTRCARKSASGSASVRLKRSPVVLEVFALVLSFLLLASQGAALSHSHSDLHLHPDCNLCLKLGSNDDVLPAVSSASAPSIPQHQYREPLVVRPAEHVLPARSRSPPASADIS